MKALGVLRVAPLGTVRSYRRHKLSLAPRDPGRATLAAVRQRPAARCRRRCHEMLSCCEARRPVASHFSFATPESNAGLDGKRDDRGCLRSFHQAPQFRGPITHQSDYPNPWRLLKLGIDVRQTTVAKYMAKRGRPPSHPVRRESVVHPTGSWQRSSRE
jgi:hypothetical protein